ncbi:MAG TPA: DUF1801 domain-containing protein [Candidatus Saccharimonadales bacterium]|nr:DUF1801 domain-containing protein [Candidatus Saccharimonadales bacterium]
MAELKTRKTGKSVKAFLDAVPDPQKRRDAQAVARLMRKVTGSPPKMWGPSIVGFGDYHFSYASGREGDWFLTGFSPRKSDLTLYIMSGFVGADELLSRLGRHRRSKACLYVKRLADLDMKVLESLIRRSVARVKRRRA